MRITNERELRELLDRLRTGRLGAEHNPRAMADLIEVLWQAKIIAEVSVREIENTTLNAQTQATNRSAFARGYMTAIEDAKKRLPVQEQMLLADLQPDIHKASALAA